MVLASITGWSRLPKLIAIWVILTMVYLAATRPSWANELTERFNTDKSRSSGWSQSYVNDQDLNDENPNYNMAIYEDAHKFPSADYFPTHFKMVSRLKGMTMAEAKAGCTWGPFETVNYQYAGDNPWVSQERSDKELELKRKEWRKFLRQELLPWEQYKDRFSGRGIVIVGGNEKSLKRIEVILRQLKRLGTKIPIEMWYYDYEMDHWKKSRLYDIYQYITFADLAAKDNIINTTDHSPLINWQYKSVAIVNSKFAEAILLDADNIPVFDPLELFESKTYKEYGSVFWPDIARTRPNNPMWAITNTVCRMDEYEQESGQMMIDKRRFWYHLQLAQFFNDKQGSYYNEFLLGDKDMFRFTWHALKTKYGKPKKWLTSMGTLNGDWYCGHTFAQYHPDNDKVAFLHGGLLKTMTKEVMTWQKEANGGVWQAYKQSPHDEDANKNTDVMIKWDGADYLPNKPKGLGVASCTDMKDVEPQPLDKILPEFEKIFKEIGGYWPLDEVKEGA